MSWKLHKTSWSPRKPKHKPVPPRGSPRVETPAPGPRRKFCRYCGSEIKSPKCASCGAVNIGGAR